MIESRCQNLSSNDPLDVHRGHVGLAMGILWLSSSKILTAPISDVLQQIDDNIFKNVTSRLNNIEKKHIGSLIDIAYYIALRLKYHSFKTTDTVIYSKLLSKIINTIYPKFYNNIAVEVYPGSYSYTLPRFILLLECSLGNSFDYRIMRIIEEIQPHVLAQIPYLISNRLALANAIITLSHKIQLHYRWCKHAKLLFESIDSQDLKNEYKTNQMSLYNGFGWFAIQLLIHRKICSNNTSILFDTLKLNLEKSTVTNFTYEELMRRDFLGIYGILGHIFIRLNIEQFTYEV